MLDCNIDLKQLKKEAPLSNEWMQTVKVPDKKQQQEILKMANDPKIKKAAERIKRNTSRAIDRFIKAQKAAHDKAVKQYAK